MASPKPRVESLKLHVSTYTGKEDETLLRWLVELETAVTARRIVDPLSKVAFAMSCLSGRAKSWAYGRRLSDPTCFSTYEVFKEELKLAFEPPKNEFRSRAEFLDLEQGKDDVHTYAQCARYLVSNIVTNPVDEATKVVTFMKGLKDGPVKTYLFREYPNTLEEAISLAIQEEFNRRQAKRHANVPKPTRPAARTGGPEPMDLSSATTAGQQQRNGGKVRCYKCSNIGHYARECTATVQGGGQRRDTQYRGGRSKKRQGPVGAGRPTDNAVARVELGHASMRTAAPSEKVSRCKKQDDKPSLVILDVMSKRVNSLRALVDSGASNNFVRQKSLGRFDFEEADAPRGVLEVRLATGATVRSEKRVVHVQLSYKRRTFVEDLIVLDLDDKFDLVLGMPWLSWHDPVIDWEKRTLVRFDSMGATESDGPVSAARAPSGACDSAAEAAAAAAASDRRWRLLTTPGVVERDVFRLRNLSLSRRVA